MSSRKKELKRQKAEHEKRINELNNIRAQLQCAYSAFNNTTDRDIMDACIFEISALKSRYNCAVINIRNNMNGESSK